MGLLESIFILQSHLSLTSLFAQLRSIRVLFDVPFSHFFLSELVRSPELVEADEVPFWWEVSLI